MSGTTAKPSAQKRARKYAEKHDLTEPPWLALCQWGNRGPLNNLHNTMLALEGDPDFQSSLGYDEMLCSATIVRAIPDVVTRGFPRIVDDHFTGLIQREIQRKGLLQVSAPTVLDAIEAHARSNLYHPIRRYLERLTWDGTLRLADWLHVYLGTPDDEYHKIVGTCWLVGMVARVMKPGCKHDYMPVLEGPQGALKSTICNILAGGYYGDDMPDLGSDAVRVSMYLRGKWLIEVSELHAFQRAEASRFKSFLTTTEERYLPKYGRKMVTEPRQCVFVASTNKETYFTDETGNRRSWPVKVGTIDPDKLEADRDQLLAEAFDSFNRGTQWWPDPALETKLFKPIQESRIEIDSWEADIADYLNHDTSGKVMPSITPGDLAWRALKIEKKDFHKPQQNRVRNALLRMGWKPGQRQNFGQPYVRP